MEKVELPIKTKIAAWLMTIIGVIIGLLGLILAVVILAEGSEFALLGSLLGLIPFFLGFLLFLGGFFLFKRKQGAWWFSITILTIESFLLLWHLLEELGEGPPYLNLGLELIIIVIFLFLLISLFFLFSDRESFFKIAK